MIRRVTLRDVALEAGVAVSTVSGILNQRPDSWASKETRDRVVGAARRLGYTPNRLARSLRLNRNNLVLVVLPDLTNPFFAGLARALNQSMEARGYEVSVEETEFKLERESRILHEIASRHVDGLIAVFANCDHHRATLEGIAASLPVVLFGPAMPGGSIDTLESDHRSSLAEAIAHLRELGHRSIGFVDPFLGFSDPIARASVFRACSAESQMVMRDEWFVRCTSDLGHVRSSICEWVKNLRGRSRPTALFCMNDMTAIATMRGLKDAGLAVPGDMSVVGFDDIALGAYLDCPLTTIAQPVETLAEIAADTIVNRISGQRVGPAAHLSLPTRLVIRSSTAIAKKIRGA